MSDAATREHMRSWADGDYTHPGEIAADLMSDLGARVANQRERLAANGAAFTYDRNGLRLGIAALEDELRELYDEWKENKKRLGEPGVAERLFDEALDVAAVAVLIATASLPNRNQEG